MTRLYLCITPSNGEPDQYLQEFSTVTQAKHALFRSIAEIILTTWYENPTTWHHLVTARFLARIPATVSVYSFTGRYEIERLNGHSFRVHDHYHAIPPHAIYYVTLKPPPERER